jgi:DNA-binding response OmpR family regulator
VSLQEPVAAADKKTVLIVDSEVLIRHPIAAYLRDCDYTVVEASTPAEARIVLEQADIPVDIILCDVGGESDMDGFALSAWVRSNRPAVPVILVASPERAAAVAGDLCESGPMLARPYDPQLVLTRIQKLLASRSQS